MSCAEASLRAYSKACTMFCCAKLRARSPDGGSAKLACWEEKENALLCLANSLFHQLAHVTRHFNNLVLQAGAIGHVASDCRSLPPLRSGSLVPPRILPLK